MRKERGQAYIFVLILLGMGALMIIAMLQTINTIVPTRQMYGSFIKEDYAADAAVEYGMWRLKHEDGFVESLPIGTESDPFYVTLNGVTANTTVSAQAYEFTFSGQDLAGRAEGSIFFKVDKTVVATSTFSILASDDFESGGSSGGTGNWTGSWSLSGDATVTPQNSPHQGSYHLRLRGDGDSSPGDGYARRQVDLSDSEGDGPYLHFWAKVNDVESENWIDLMVSLNGTDWDILHTFGHEESGDPYAQYAYDLSSYGTPSTFYVAFDMDGNHSSDEFLVDDLRFSNSQEGSSAEPGVLTEYTYYITFECMDPDGCNESNWPRSGLDRIVDELPARGAESGDYLQYIYGSTEWDVVSYNSFAYDGLESGGSSGGTGSWTSNWSLSGDASVSASQPYQGTYAIRIRGDGDQFPGDGYAQRRVNLSGSTGEGPYLSFYARVSDVESNNSIDVKLSTNGIDWSILDTFSDDESDNQYHEYRYNLSSYGRPSSLYLAFEMDGDHDSDRIDIDNIEFSDYNGISTGEWTVPPFDPTMVDDYGSGESLYQFLEWDFEDAGYDDMDFAYGETRTMSFRAQAALEEGSYCNKIWVSSESSGDEGAIVSGTTAKIIVGSPLESRCGGGLIDVNKVSDPEIVYPYEPTTVTYTITIENVDVEDITIYEIEDWLPATGSTLPEEGFIYVDNSAWGRIIRPASIAFDGFESGGLSGGTGNWSGGWNASGDYTVSNVGPYLGTYHMMLRGDDNDNPGPGYAYREVDLSGYSEVELRYWAKANAFESGDEVQVKVTTTLPVYTDIAFDGFETGSGTGGTGAWNGNWSFSGDYWINTSDWPYDGSWHLRLQDDGGSAGVATREADLTGFSNGELRFYAKLWSLESGDTVYVKASTNGADWDTLDTFNYTDADNQYHSYTYDLSGYGATSSLYIRFESDMNSGWDDYFWVDNIELIDNGGGYWEVIETIEDGDDDNQYHSYSYNLSSYGSPSSFYIAFDASELSSNQDYFYFDNVEFRDYTAESDTLVCMPDENLGGNFLIEDWEYDWPYWEYRWSLYWDFSNYPGENDPVWDEGGVCEGYEWEDYNPYLVLSPGEIFEITFQASGTLTYSGSYFNEVFVHIDNNWYEGWLYSWPTGSVIVPQYDLEAETLNSVLRANAMLSPDGHWWRSWHWWFHH